MPNSTASSKSLQVYRRLLSYARNCWFALCLGLFGTLLSSATDAGFTWLLKPLLDKGFIAKDPHFIRWIPLGIMVFFILRGVASYISNYYMNWAGRQVVMRFRQELFSHLLHLPAAYFDNTSSGQLLSTLIYNVEQVAKASTDAVVTIVQESCFILGLLLVMAVTSWRLTLLFLITMPVLALIAKNSSQRMRGLSVNVQQAMGEITHIAEEAIEGYKAVRIFGGTQYEVDKFNHQLQLTNRRELKLINTNSLASIAVQLIAGMAVAITILLATRGVTQISAGAFTSLIAAMLAMLKPMRNLATVNSCIQKGIAGAESLFKLLDTPLESNMGVQKMVRARGLITYKDVSYAYHRESKLILNDINFTAEPGQTIALVGRSGSGKSTLVSLLPRFYDHYTGKISIDNIDIQDLKLDNLRNQFALVSQNITLFNDTIAHNIAYGSLADTTEAKIITAAKAAHAMEFIQELPQGIHTVIGDNGVLLSGGQRQRLAIARALLKDAPILILDEATSALDSESERLIQTALEQLIQHRTTLVIAHRLSTVEKADLILVIEDGCIIEKGTHTELLKINGHYAKLQQLQFGNS